MKQTLRAGFEKIEITPAIGTHKVGWLSDNAPDRVRDPLYACAAAFHDGARGAGFIQLDTLSVRWSTAAAIRRGIAERCGCDGASIMIGATHNHAGPAATTLGLARRDDVYVTTLIERCVAVFDEAWRAMLPARVRFGTAEADGLAFNRRTAMRDGTSRCGWPHNHTDSLGPEGPADPEVRAVGVERLDGAPLGCFVNFGCHPTHYGDDSTFSAGYPGILGCAMREAGWPVALFQNGACGNIGAWNPAEGKTMDAPVLGQRLADAALRALANAQAESAPVIREAHDTILLQYREPTADAVAGTARGAQRFTDPAIYDAMMPELVKRIQKRGRQPAEVQAIRVGSLIWIGIPGELFVEYQLRLKEALCPNRLLLNSCTNGMLGYIPTRAAIAAGGYEATFAPWSRMAAETGDLLCERAVQLARSLDG